MKFRPLFSALFVVVLCIGAGILYKIFLKSQQFSDKIIYIYGTQEPGVREDIQFFRKTLKLYDIKRTQIIENPSGATEESSIKIFFDQLKFDESVKRNDLSLKIAIRLQNNAEENPKVTGVFVEDKTEELLEFIESVVKQPINCILFFDDGGSTKQKVAKFQELAKIKKFNLKVCQLKPNQNISTVLKEEAQNVNSVILLPGRLVLEDSERMIENFSIHKIPVFANHAGLIRTGAIGGFDFDSQEIAYNVAENIIEFLKNPSNFESESLRELYSQLHLNMDAINKLGIQLDPDILDEAITVGGADL